MKLVYSKVTEWEVIFESESILKLKELAR